MVEGIEILETNGMLGPLHNFAVAAVLSGIVAELALERPVAVVNTETSTW